jgi:nitrile hydratase accessory protein
MFTRFEEFAAAQMLGSTDSPPRAMGKLHFEHAWQRSLFGLTLALSKQGHFEWEDFRRNLIRSIANWEQTECVNQPPWDYYERFLSALLKTLEAHGIDALVGVEFQELLRDRPRQQASVEAST